MSERERTLKDIRSDGGQSSGPRVRALGRASAVLTIISGAAVVKIRDKYGLVKSAADSDVTWRHSRHLFFLTQKLKSRE
jgi:hypothetical protein